MRTEMKRRAKETEETTSQTLRYCLTPMPVAQAHLLQTKTALTRDICRHRQCGRPSDQDVNPYSNAIDGNLFIRINDIEMMIFSAQVDIYFLAQNRHWFADGIF